MQSIVTNPRFQGGNGELFNGRHDMSDRVWEERCQDKFPELGMIGAIMEEKGMVTNDPLLARWECGLEKIGLG